MNQSANKHILRGLDKVLGFEIYLFWEVRR